MHSHMEEPKEYGPMVQSDCTEKVMEITSHKKEEAHKLYQLMNLSMHRIIQEIDLRKINYKLMWFAQGDNNLEWKTNQLMCLERALGEVKPHLPMRPIPRTTGFFHLAENDAETPVNKSSYGDYLSPVRYVKDIVARKEDIVGLRHVFDKHVFDRPGL
ncbi:hypothetical protein L1887_31927 [Cichorium endivia]|nr:hypothetical protein L1887_31927 [Cichorium endivia]